MKLTIINGAPDDSYTAFEAALNDMQTKQKGTHEITVFNVRDMDVKYCTGCFGCWIKTPGECLIKDEMATILESSINSDLQLYLSPITAGFMSATAKKVLDRTVPLVVPYIRNFDGECHHPPRYKKRPDIGIVLMDDGDINQESVDITYDVFDRLTRNFHAKRVIKTAATANKLAEVIANEAWNN